MSHKKSHKHDHVDPPKSGPKAPHNADGVEMDRTRWLIRPEWWTVIFTGILAFFAMGSFVELWIQVRDARAAFVKDQRPYVWVTPQVPTIKLGEPIRWDVHYSNYGRSPALNFHSCIQAAYGIAGLDGVRFPSMEDSQCSQKAFRSESVVPPGFPAYSTSLGDKPLSEKDVSDIEAYDGGALIVGVLQYDDSRDIPMKPVFVLIASVVGQFQAAKNTTTFSK